MYRANKSYYNDRLSEGNTRIGNFSRRAFPSGYTGSAVALDFVRAQLAICQKHQLCREVEAPKLPTRIIDFGDPQGAVRLKETHGQYGRYAALSHCWGQDVTFKTLSGSYPRYIESLPFDRSPKTFREAIAFCRKLGLTRIWIDSLCIIQDSRQDWLNESRQMQNIYQNAYITLAATASPNSDKGCFQSQRHQHLPIAHVEGHPSKAMYLRRRWTHVNQPTGDHSRTTVSTLQLLERGWVLQERLLSRRVVHFTMNEIMWECRQMETCECLNGLPISENPFDPWEHPESITSGFKGAFARVTPYSPKPTRAAMWLALVERYSALSLSHDSDRLSALAGIARSMSGSGFGQYLAGLWSGYFGKCLCWVARQPPGRRLRHSVPSWSWASVREPVFYDSEWNHDRDTYVPLMFAACFPDGPDVYGGVHYGYVKMSVDLVAITLIKVADLSPELRQVNSRLRRLPAAIWMRDEVRLCKWDDDTCLQWLSESDQPDAQTFKPATYCFNITVIGLTTHIILRCEDWANKIFRRVGVIGRRSELSGCSNRAVQFSENTQRIVRRVMEEASIRDCVITII